MNRATWSIALWLVTVASGQGQQIEKPSLFGGTEASCSQDATFTVQGTSVDRERLVRSQIQLMRPVVLPNRVIFVPHWKYIYATKMFHLHVPTGMGSNMFTHLPSRSIFTDADCYAGDDWLGHWMAHELGHLERNKADENQAEKAAAKYRRRLNVLGRTVQLSGALGRELTQSVPIPGAPDPNK